MLLRANELPIWALPIGERAMTNSAATAARTPESRSARTRIQLVLMPPRLAARSSKPTARTSRPDPEACSQRSSRPAPTTMTMNAIGIGPTLVLRNDTRSSLMIPCAVGRRVSEIPSRMLSVAKVAMSDGILKPLISTALTNPRPRPQARIAAIPIRISTDEASPPIRNDPTTTPKLIIAPTDRSRYPTRIACVWAMATSARGIASSSTVVMLARLMNPSNRDSVYQSRATISSTCSATGIHSRTLTILRHSFLSRALRATLRASRLARSTCVVWTATVMRARPSRQRRRGRLGHRHPSGDLARLRHPWTANDGLDDAGLVELVAEDLLDDGASRHHEHAVTEPESSIGSLDLTSSAAPAAPGHGGPCRCRCGSRRRHLGSARRPGSPTAP